MPAPGEAWELMRISSLKTLRALQTLAKLASQLCSDISKHRYMPVQSLLPSHTQCPACPGAASLAHQSFQSGAY